MASKKKVVPKRDVVDEYAERIRSFINDQGEKSVSDGDDGLSKEQWQQVLKAVIEECELQIATGD